jgi:DNA-binding transcriptional LysR family regulator
MSDSDYDQLEFRHLKYIKAIAEEGGFTAASDRVHITQSTISTQIKQLEEFFQVDFFTREPVELTPFGVLLLAAGEDLLELREEIVDMLLALRTGEITPLRLGFSSLVEKRTLGSITETIRRIFPYCDIQTDGDEIQTLVDRVDAGDLDGALVTLPVEHRSDLMTCIVERDLLYVCMRSDDPLTSHEAIPAHLLNGKLSLFQYPKVHHAAHIRLLELLHSVGITPKKANPITNREQIQWIVQEGHYYALFRKGSRLMPGLTCRPIHGVDWTIDTAVILKPESQHPALAMFMRELRRRTVQTAAKWTRPMTLTEGARDRKKKPQSVRGSSTNSRSSKRVI